MIEYYDRNGHPIADMNEWSRLFGDRDYQQLRSTYLGDGELHVSTIWLGLDHQWGDGPPLIFETMIFGGKWNEHQWRYSTENEALADHERIVQALRDGLDPEGER